ncbi:unnamed protein product [Leptosia nina]|uniref:Farnesoic acid O-methyl transferase domain-containing protein n=1 Tax=Leptosia nina TaxID=320188 RepID=A0AAV1J1L7_9NEOP
MGEVVEFLTAHKNGRQFYKFSNNSLTFSLKGSGYAVIGLSDSPEVKYRNHWIYINRHGHTGVTEYQSVHSEHEVLIAVETPDIISEDRYQKFWLTWYDKLELGKSGITEPIFSHEIVNNNMKYVSFASQQNTNSVEWRFVSPPLIERPVLKPIEGGKMYWVKYDGLLPYGALIGGYENEFLYIMRAPHEGSLTPGKFVPSTKCGFVSWGGYMHLKNKFEILCGHDCTWVKTRGNVIPCGALPAGYTEYDSATVYIGRCKRDKHTIPGKVANSDCVCFFPYNGEEIYDAEYEILVAPYSSPRYSPSKTVPNVKVRDYIDQNI